MNKYSNDIKDVRRRAKSYDCDGLCYSRHKTCNRIDYCPETRSREFTATVIAVILLVSFYLAIIVIVLAAFINNEMFT